MIDISSIDFEGLAHSIEHDYPDMISGRTVHIDADFLAYMVSAEKEGDPKTFEDMQHNAETVVDHLRKMAAAQFVHMHLTPSSSNKGGRYAIAIQKPYQGNREDKPKPRMLHIMRNWLAERYPGTQYQFCEADDGMASAQYAAIARGEEHLSIIASKDKDLDMVPGWHMVWETGKLIHTNDRGTGSFGWVDLIEKKSATGQVSKKIKGYGTKFLWAQMLIGDTADNIAGLPKLVGSVMNSVSPTMPVAAAKETLENPDANDKQKEKARKILNERKPGLCGPATAIKLLDKMQSDKQAFMIVRSLYELYGQEIGFFHHDTGQPVDWGQVFLSEAQLLWMRRNNSDPNDVIHWLKEINE